MELDFDFDFIDIDGCGPEGLGILVLIGGIAGAIAVGATILAEHPMFVVAATFLFLTIFFAVPRRKKSHTKPSKTRSRWRISLIIFSFVGFAIFATMGVQDYRVAAQQRQEQEVREQLEQERIEAENKRLGAWGRLKRWAGGDKEDTNSENE
jgi:type VI protein secretion system component VasK